MRRTALVALAALSCAASARGAQLQLDELDLCPPGHVTPPPGWYAGDTHDHVQLCDSKSTTPGEIFARMQATGLDVASVLVWGPGIDTQADFDGFMAQVTGSEAPISLGSPQVLQFGVEVSDFTAAKFGHVIGLNIGPAQTAFYDLGLGCGGLADRSGDFAAPVLDVFRQAPGAVTGYAHTVWPLRTHLDAAKGGWDWQDPDLPAYVGFDARCSFGRDLAFPVKDVWNGDIHPILAAIDVAMRRIDFIEAFDLCPHPPSARRRSAS